jgi:hypothetical protein
MPRPLFFRHLRQPKLNLLLFSILFFTSPAHPQSSSDGLNAPFGFNLWADTTLWDDQVELTARRLGLTGSINAANSFYRGLPARTSTCLGAQLFAVDLYGQNSLIQRVVLGFVNRADLATRRSHLSSLSYPEAAQKEMALIRTKLTERLGPATVQGNTERWGWLSHELILQQGPEALTLTIQKRAANTAQDPAALPLEKNQSVSSLTRFVKRGENGDVYIENLPPISQGNRNYCVPASWEKVLRHLGLGLNVYDLAQKGGTQVDGTLYEPFKAEMKKLLLPSGYQVVSIPRTANDFNSLKPYINQGLPIIWGMNANRLAEWIVRVRDRRDKLPATTFSNVGAPPAPHALLIIGYNNFHQEVALSDSTELGSSTPVIWIRVQEMIQAEFQNNEKIVVLPPGNSPSSGGGIIRPKWY